MVCRQEDPLSLFKLMETADPLPSGPGEYQADPVDLARMEREPEGLMPSESTASDSSSSIQQGFKQPLDNTGYKADPRPISEQRSE